VVRTTSFEILALGFVILLCFALRIYHLGAASLWSDEIFLGITQMCLACTSC
jgi:hypothetical protein